MAEPKLHGRFVWQELVVPDTAAASAFYSSLVGWRTESTPAMPDYPMFKAGGDAVAGLQQMAGGGAGPHWLPYIGTRSVDETAAAAVRLGGKLTQAPTDLPSGGRIAVLADPQGAAFGIYHSSGPVPAAVDRTTLGQFSWQELVTSDFEAAISFYGELFGWQTIERMNMGPSMVYLIFGAEGHGVGGMANSSQPGSGAHWIPYATVADVEAALATVTASGGQILHGPVSVPDGGRILQLLDPAGAAFAVYAFPAKAAAETPAEKKPAAKKPPAKKPPAKKTVAPVAAAKKAAATKSKSKMKPQMKAKTKAKTNAKTPERKLKGKVTAKPKSKAKSKATAKPKSKAKAKVTGTPKGKAKGKRTRAAPRRKK